MVLIICLWFVDSLFVIIRCGLFITTCVLVLGFWIADCVGVML